MQRPRCRLEECGRPGHRPQVVGRALIRPRAKAATGTRKPSPHRQSIGKVPGRDVVPPAEGGSAMVCTFGRRAYRRGDVAVERVGIDQQAVGPTAAKAPRRGVCATKVTPRRPPRARAPRPHWHDEAATSGVGHGGCGGPGQRLTVGGHRKGPRAPPRMAAPASTRPTPACRLARSRCSPHGDRSTSEGHTATSYRADGPRPPTAGHRWRWPRPGRARFGRGNA